MKCLQDRLWQFYQRLEADAACPCKSARFDFEAKLLKSKLGKIANGSKSKKVRGAGRGKEMCNILTTDATAQMTQI